METDYPVSAQPRAAEEDSLELKELSKAVVKVIFWIKLPHKRLANLTNAYETSNAGKPPLSRAALQPHSCP